MKYSEIAEKAYETYYASTHNTMPKFEDLKYAQREAWTNVAKEVIDINMQLLFRHLSDEKISLQDYHDKLKLHLDG